VGRADDAVAALRITTTGNGLSVRAAPGVALLGRYARDFRQAAKPSQKKNCHRTIAGRWFTEAEGVGRPRSRAGDARQHPVSNKFDQST